MVSLQGGVGLVAIVRYKPIRRMKGLVLAIEVDQSTIIG